MRVNRYETTPRERVECIRSRLRTCATEEQALDALSPASPHTLRVLESDYMSTPGPADTLRERIAACHAAVVHARIPMSTANITEPMVAGWARECLSVWFGGYTDYDAAEGGQYHIVLMEHDEPNQLLVEVTSINGHEPRRFVLTVHVTEVAS